MSVLRLCVALCCVTLVAASAAGAVAWYDSNGFEPQTFAPGALTGQDGWAASAANGGTVPTVVTSPCPVVGTQSVALVVGTDQGDSSMMSRAIADPIAAGYRTITVTYDIYRCASNQNLWWWWEDAGEPTYGLQWDLGGTFPHGWNPGAGSTPTVLGRFVTLKMEWDLTAGKAYSWYDGVMVDNGIPCSGITALTGWSIYLSHDSDTGKPGDNVYIDNFRIDVSGAVPEPASLLALATGLLGLGGLVIGRRS